MPVPPFSDENIVCHDWENGHRRVTLGADTCCSFFIYFSYFTLFLHFYKGLYGKSRLLICSPRQIGCVGILRGFAWVFAWVFCVGLRGSKKSRGESLERISKILK